MGKLTVSVAVDQKIYHIDSLYTYLVPEELSQSIAKGKRVMIPFGNANHPTIGMITDLGEYDGTSQLKSVISVIDNEPMMNDEMLSLMHYLKKTTFCTYYSAIQLFLPVGIGYSIDKKYSTTPRTDIANTLSGDLKAVYDRLMLAAKPLTVDQISELTGIENCDGIIRKLLKCGAVFEYCTAKQNVSAATVKMVRPAKAPEGIKLSLKQLSVYEALSKLGCASIKELCYFTGVGVSVVTNLISKGIIIAYDIPKYRMPYHFPEVSVRPEINLTELQQAAYDRIVTDYTQNGKNISLLFGVTGSGKTQIFLKLVDRCIDEGKKALIMVPEISLTPQTLRIFSRRYGDRIAVLHSAMSKGQRMDEWRRIKNSTADIVIGTRSAVFSPLDNIGLIVIDEEQEGCYKSEMSPRFHAGDIAKFRAKYHNALCVFSSATPSVETYSKANSDIYGLATVPERYGNAVLPEVITVDMRKELAAGNTSALSRCLTDELESVLNDGKQAILLLNRRGHNTFVSCSSCNHVMTCDNCSISLTYHSANNRLVCHYCGKSIPFVSKCPVCGNDHIKYSGQGTQKVEAELKLIFPSARILRMDADSTVTRTSFEENISAFADKKYDIMLGTQMVAKGLDFPDVTLVGVLYSDQSLYSDDFRSFEKTFSLLTQVIGRSGRGDFKGKAIIQTNDPDNEIIRLAANQDYVGFYDREILTRKLMVYPPYCFITVVYTMAEKREDAETAANFFSEYIKNTVSGDYSDVKLIILGPTVGSIPKINNKYRYRIIFKHKNNKRVHELFDAAILSFSTNKAFKNVTLMIDPNPESIN